VGRVANDARDVLEGCAVGIGAEADLRLVPVAEEPLPAEAELIPDTACRIAGSSAPLATVWGSALNVKTTGSPDRATADSCGVGKSNVVS